MTHEKSETPIDDYIVADDETEDDQASLPVNMEEVDPVTQMIEMN
jgi:hypothetical protein